MGSSSSTSTASTMEGVPNHANNILLSPPAAHKPARTVDRKQARARAEELAREMGLVDGSWRARMRSGQSLSPKVTTLSQAIFREEPNFKKTIMAYFSSQFLPAFLELYQHRYAAEQAPEGRFCLVTVLREILEHPSFSHYVRWHSASTEIFEMLVKDMNEHTFTMPYPTMSTIEVLRSKRYGEVESCSFEARLLILLTVVKIAATFPDLESSHLLRPSRLIHVTQLALSLDQLNLKLHDSSMSKQEMDPGTDLYRLDALAYALTHFLSRNLLGSIVEFTKSTFKTMRFESDYTSELNSWHFCPVCLVADSRNLPALTCGKCLGVKYCTTEHQREHWKTHKYVCMKPTW